MRIEWNISVVQDPRDLQESVVLTLQLATLCFQVSFDPRDAGNLGSKLVEAAAVSQQKLVTPDGSRVVLPS